MSKRGFIPGNHWVLCDRCGFDYRRSEIRREWTGLMVCPDCWDSKPVYRPAPSDKISVENPRPEPPDVFLEYGEVKPEDL